MGWALSQADNPNNTKTPLQFTDPRGYCIIPWEGTFYPDVATSFQCKEAGIELANRIMERERLTGQIVEKVEDIYA